MKNIFYICTKYVGNWDIFIPSESKDTTLHRISVLLLHREQYIQNGRISQVCYLNLSEHNTHDTIDCKNITYQEFLEQIFVHDLTVVI
jgi:hypothetical protein